MPLSNLKMPSVKHLATASVMALFVFANAVNATTRVKANIATNLNQTGSWTGGVVPTSSDIGQWNNTSGPTGNTVSLGGDMTWQGIQIANNATAWITIYAGNTLTLGTSGFDMTASPQSMTINCLIGLGGVQTWNVNSGQLLAVNAAISGSNATYSLTKNGSGTLYFNDNNTYTGQTIVSAGVLAFSKNGGVKGGVYSYGTAAGTIVINNGGTVRLDTNDFMGAHTSTPVATVTINAGGTMASNTTFSTLNNLTLSGGTLQSNGGTSGWGSFGLKGTVTVNGTVTSNISTGTGADNNVFVGTNTAGGTTTFNVGNTASSGDDLDVSSVLTNNHNAGGTPVAGGLIKTGAGTMMLSGANTFTGGVTISNGILKAGSTTALGDVGNTVTISSGAALDVNAINLQGYTNPITINGQIDANNGAIYNSGADQQNAILKIALGSDASFGGPGGRCDIGRGLASGYAISGNSHTLTKVGTDMIPVLYTSTGLTAVIVNGGRLQNEVADAFGAAPITVNSQGILSSYNSLTITNNLTLNDKSVLQSSSNATHNTTYSGTIATSGSDTLRSNGINTITLSNVISGTGELVKLNAGVFILSNTSNSWSGGLTITSGKLTLGASGVIPDGSGKGNVTVNDTLDLNAKTEGINGLSGSGYITSGAAGSITFTVGNNNAASTFSGVIQNGSGTVALTKAGAGTLILSGANTYTGITTISGGVLQIGGGGATGSISNSSNVTDNATLDFNLSGSYTYSGVLSGSGAVIQDGAGATTLSGTTNSYSNGTTINAGTLIITTPFSLGASHSTVTLNGGTLQVPNGIYDTNAINVTGTSTISEVGAGSAYILGTVSSAGATDTLTVDPASTQTISFEGDLSGFTGVIILNSDSMRIRNASGTNNATIYLTGGAGLNFNKALGASIQIGSLKSASGTFIRLPRPYACQVGALNGTDTIAGIIVDSNTAFPGSLTKVGSGTLTLSGANTYSGVTTISAGTIRASTLANGGTGCALGSASNAAANLVINGGSLSYSGGTQGCDRLFTVGASGATIRSSGTGALTFSNTGSIAYSGSTTHSITFAGSNTAANTFAPVIGNDGGNAVSVTKSSAGEWVFTGANTYSGGTTISAGTLLVNNSSGSGTGTGAVSVTGATLGGTGTISGAVSVNSGATLAPAGSGATGILNLGGNLTFVSGATYSVEINGTTAGTNYDQVNMTNATGTTTLSNATLTVTLGYTPTIGDVITIISNGSSNNVVGTFNNISEGGTVSAVYNGNTATFTVSYVDGAGTDVSLTCGSITGASVDDYAQWHYSKKVYINTKEGGANISTDQSNFPLLVRLTSANFNFSQAQSSGNDIRFSKSTGVHFPYQIERWDNVNQLAELWVTVDVIKGYNDAQYIMMYWGNSAAADSSNSAKVFDTANGFVGVWHLGEASGNALDATINGIKDTAKGTINYQRTGGIGYSDSLVGSGSYLVAGNGYNTLLNMHARNKVTVSAWVNRAGAATGNSGNVEGIAGKYKWTSNFREYCIGNNATTGFAFWVSSNGTAETSVSSAIVPTIGTWYYVTGVMDATNMTIFVNGVQKAQTGYTTISATTTSPFRIGLMDDDGSNNKQYFNGEIDEVIVADTNRSSDWITLCYQTQKANQTTVVVQENYSDWTYSQNLYLNTKATGANVTNNVVKFPVLIRLDTTNFDFTKAQSSGQDIRFTKQDGSTRLYYQIEQWDNVNQAAAIWVRADTVYGNDSTHYITMYWGNNKVNDLSNGKAVFDTGNGFQGVWHFNEGTNSTAFDATANGYNGTASGTTTPADTNGMVGRGRKYDGSTSYFVCTGTASSKLNFPQGGIYTISTWVNSNVVTASHDIVCKADKQYALHISSGANWEFFEFNITDGWESVGYAPNLGWTHLVGVRNGANEYLYVNGVMVDNTISTNSSGARVTNTDVCIGRQGDVSARFWNGKIDETEMSNVARDQYWVKLCYQNQKPGQSLVMFTNEDYSTWAYSRKVNLNTTPCGANVATTQFKFPVLIRLTSANFPFAQAQDDGSDLRFASFLGNHLPYQIERWDRNNQLAEIWVLADSVSGNNGTQYLTMYWGKAGVVSRSNGAAVFNSANNFYAVYHLNDNPANGTGSIKDQTSNAKNGNPTSMDATNIVSGQIGNGLSFDGVAEYVDFGNISIHNNTAYTVSAWVNGASAQTDLKYFSEASSSSGNPLFTLGTDITASNAKMEVFLRNDAATILLSHVASNADVFTSSWHHVVFVDNNGSYTFYVDGLTSGTGSYTKSATTFTNTAIGAILRDTGSSFWAGKLDEVRLCNTNRSDDWIKLCYQNQKTNQTLVDLDDYNQWASSKKIYINTTVVSPVLGAKVAMFPLLVRLDTTMINFNSAQSLGQDIRFSRADGTHFYYEKEKWDQANKNAVLWVLVDTILPSSSTQYITMYWGKSDAVDKSNSSAVFDTANSFVAAYHFSVSDTFGDATYNSNDGTNSSTTPNASSIIGYGRSFAKASTQKITAADANILDLTGSFTLSAWINPTTLDTADIIGKDSTAYDLEMIPTKYLRLGSNKTYYLSSAASTITTGSWYHVAATYNSTGNPIYFYVNGSQVGTSVTGAAPVATATTLYIGARASGKYFNGSIDEPRVEKVVRGADWINLCYWTQKAGVSTVITDTSSEVFLPLTVSPYPASGTSIDSCNISTHNWTIKFSAASKGGGIYWLSPDSMGTGSNQLDTNLFTIITGTTGTPDSTSKGTASMTLLDNSNVIVRLMQQRTINSLPFQVYYTIQGNGKVFIRAYTYAASAASMTNGLEFRIATNGASGTTNYYPSATASSCNYLLHSDPASNRLDPCLVLFENWSQATSITSGTRYVGLKASSWSLPAHRSQAWEFMLDFAHRNWNDSTGVGSYVSEYSHPDSLTFYSGTPYLEKSWEDHLTGHWKFEEGTGDTAFDNSGSNNPGIRTAGSTWNWTSGKWGGGLSLRTADSVKVVDNTLFDGGSSGFTVMAWVNPTATMTSNTGIFRKNNTSGSTGYALTGASNGSVQLNLNGTTFGGRTNVNAGSWRHVGAVYQNRAGSQDTVKLFVDGKPDTIVTGSTYSFNSSGNNALMGPGFNGTLDDVRFYDEAINDEQFKTIYQLGYASGQGMYMLRADNNNEVNFTIDGGTYHRNFPVFQVSNWWNSAALGANNPYVYMNGSQLTYNKDYYIMTDGNLKKVTVGFNQAINSDGTRIYIGSDQTQAGTTNSMPQMAWGSYAWPSAHFFVKNFTGCTFGAATAKQFYMDFKMDIGTTGSGGEIYRFKTSKISPTGTADTSTTGNLAPLMSANDSGNFSTAKLKIGTSWLASTGNIIATPTYTVVESSAVRVILKINDRKMKHGTDSCNIQTWFTFYPTGQIFRWDSIYVPNGTINIDTIRYDVLETYVSSGAGTGLPASIITAARLKGGIYGATNLQDFAAAFLVLDTLNGAVYGAETPSVKDTARIYSISASPNKGLGDRFVHCAKLLNANKPYQTALFMDIHSSTFNAAAVDSVCKSVQNSIGTAGSARLTTNGNGSTVLNSPGDLNGDGFDEREGVYVYKADNSNTAHFTLLANSNANGDTCRLYPAFRITNYTASTVPQYIFVAGKQLVSGYGYNAYLKRSTDELILQLNNKYCANTDIYISPDKTLAVTMADFNANGGDGLVRLNWVTESEENNLGFFVYRRVKPHFVDSLIMSPAPVVSDTSSDSSDEKSPGLLFKTKVIGFGDTTWKQVNDRIIYGAMAGVSYGKRAYSLLDRGLFNSVQYEYKLVAVDYNNGRDAYDKLAEAMPHRMLPMAYELYGNFPNPFRSITYLKFDIPVKSRAMLNVYTIQGGLIRRIVKPGNVLKPGFYRVAWDCKDDNGRLMASGPYIYRFTAPGFAKAKIMIVMK